MTPPSLQRLGLLCLVTVLAACGGGGSTPPDGAPSSTTTTTTVATTTTTTVTPMGSKITDVVIRNDGAARNNVPVTFAQVFAAGQLSASETVTGKLADQSNLPLQVNVKARHADGSIRHAIISTTVPQMNAQQNVAIDLVKTVDLGVPTPATPAGLLGAGFTADVQITSGGQTYSAAAQDLLNGGGVLTWFGGPQATEWVITAPLKTSGGTAHPILTAQFAIRYYPTSNQARVDVTVENTKTFTPGVQNIVYDVNVNVGGQSVYSKVGLEHFHHARWRKMFWWGRANDLHIKHNSAYLMMTKAVPNYDANLVIPESTLVDLQNLWLASDTSPMGGASGGPGMVVSFFGTGGGRPDIGPLPKWAVLHILTMDKRAREVTLGVGDQAGTWPIHYRDEATGLPVRLDNDINRDITIHPNGNSYGPLPVPRCVNGASFVAPCDTRGIMADTAHQPSMAYLPYLLTGDYYYLEELQFWAAYTPLETGGGYRDYEKGLPKWDQIRGQAWSMRTMGQVAYITPDDHPLKAYVKKQLDYSIAYYTQQYVKANHNLLGIIETLDAATSPKAYAIQPWQDDFFTWSMGYLVELGFEDAKPMFQFKAKFPVGRMNTAQSGYCWIDASTQALIVRPASNPNGPYYTTLRAAYLDTFSNTDSYVNGVRSANGDRVTGAANTVYENTPYLNYPCASADQAGWRGSGLNDMSGYSGSALGTPAILGAALAVTADPAMGILGAGTAWSQFMARSVIPNYGADPQWALVPRQ